MSSLRVLEIIDGTIVDGPGLRTSIYFAGCAHQCPGCHNPLSWDFDGGHIMTVGEIMARIKENGFGVTFTGGDPLYQIEPLIELASAVKRAGFNLWCYTGFTVEEICSSVSMRRLIPYLDALVDGPFVQPLRDTTLRFRGSSNQRILYKAELTAMSGRIG